jgi:DNA-binding NarL/FixJ family response regulator
VSELTLVVCESDPVTGAAVEAVARAQGFQVVARCANAVELLHLLRSVHPHVVVIRHELPGTMGLDAARELQSTTPSTGSDAPGGRTPLVVLTTSAPDPHVLAADPALADALRWGDLPALEATLARLREQLVSGERRRGTDRRSGQDRRKRQDWTKVFAERRSGQDRRRGDRRRKDGEAD